VGEHVGTTSRLIMRSAKSDIWPLVTPENRVTGYVTGNSYYVYLEPLLNDVLNVNNTRYVHLCKYMNKNIIPSKFGNHN
jgi:hypothetical protein